MNNAFTITPETQLLQTVASTNSSRYSISGVYFEKDHAVATNGCVMAIQKIKPEKDEDNCSNPSGIIRFDKAKQPTKLGKLEHYPEHNGNPSVVGSKGSVASHVDAQFPDWRQVLPKKFKKPVCLSFDVKQLIRLATAIEPYTHGRSSLNSITIEFDADDSLAPVLVIGGNKNKVGIIMPVKQEENAATPQEQMADILTA